MTTGQRISDKRKELGLSQEALGEKLSVSRQSIYKWESDASLPDVDKLIALSRLFSVSVGWLLGVEDNPATETASQIDWEQRQEQIVEDVLRRYQAAQPKPHNLSREKWAILLLCSLCGIMLSVILSIDKNLDKLDSKYRALENSIDQISYDTTMELDSMTERLECVLRAQGDLAVDYVCEIKAFDLFARTVTFSLSVVPKTYTEGMEVIFQIDSTGEVSEFTAQKTASQTFTCDATCPLTDRITVSAVFKTGDTRQLQLLNEYFDLFRGSLPDLSPKDTVATPNNELGTFQSNGSFQISEHYVYFPVYDDLSGYKTDLGYISITSAEVGLFHNGKLVHWLQPSHRPSHFGGNAPNSNTTWDEYFHDGFTYFYSPSVLLQNVNEGDEFLFSVRITDEYGNISINPCRERYVIRNGDILPLDATPKSKYTDPTYYQFELSEEHT